MSKTVMPEPVVEVDKHTIASELQYTYLAPCGGLEHGTELITTAQAEAYKDACVRVALEEALIEVMRCKTSGIIRNDTVDKCADAIRALIPPTE